MPDYANLVAAFRLTWDNLPSSATLVDKNGIVVAANKIAEAHGTKAGVICSTLLPLERHKGCLRDKAIKTHTAQIDRPKNIRGWLPIDGYPDVVINFALHIPEINK